jgi:anti-sigma28 factor (negative regulator of flagellin synthesis)
MQNRIKNWNPQRVVSAAVLERLSADSHVEMPGQDGVRHKLVARIKAEIEAGTYDTEEKWAAAEARIINSLI